LKTSMSFGRWWMRCGNKAYNPTARNTPFIQARPPHIEIDKPARTNRKILHKWLTHQAHIDHF
jgi:hypothetical protein